MCSILILPGIGNSSADHWQSLWQAGDSAMRRIAPSSWDNPQADDWILALDRAVAASPEPAILVAHSLGCLLVALWADQADADVAGAFLVAPPDPTTEAFPEQAASFANVPWKKLRFPSLIVASDDDPYGSPDYARRRAGAWGSGLVSIGHRGHINGSSGLADWREGRNLLAAFRAGLARRPA